MASDESTSKEPLGFSLDIDKILRDTGLTGTKRRRRRTTTSTSSNDMDAAVRRAVRAELVDVERALRSLAEEVVKLRRSNEQLADQVARLQRR
jgi:hypothetical protein